MPSVQKATIDQKELLLDISKITQPRLAVGNNLEFKSHDKSTEMTAILRDSPGAAALFALHALGRYFFQHDLLQTEQEKRATPVLLSHCMLWQRVVGTTQTSGR